MRSGGYRDNLYFSPSIHAFEHSDYDFVFIDSVQGEQLGYDEFKAMKADNPFVNYILVMQVTKDNKARGTNEWAHEVDITARVEDGMAQVEKTRTGQQGAMQIF